jgi:hypothetical protein
MPFQDPSAKMIKRHFFSEKEVTNYVLVQIKLMYMIPQIKFNDD